jgi:hypothetical protein
MTVITTRLYDTPQNAKGAVTKLKKSHFSDDQIVVVSGEGKSPDAVAAAIKALGVPASAIKTFGAAIGGGASLVAVRPAFGKAGEAGDILNSFSPTASEEFVVAEDTSAPVASSGGPDWAALSADPTPLSSYFNWQLLSDKKFSLSNWLKWDLLSSDSFPVSKLFGWKLLSDNPTPASKAFNWKLLSDDPTPLSSKYKWTLLLNDPTPLSSKFNWSVLSK